MVGAPVVDALCATPVVGTHVVSAPPLIVADVLLMVGVVIVATLSERHERSRAEAEKNK